MQTSVDICKDVKESDCGCCGEISGTQVDCRVFEYEGKLYEVYTTGLNNSNLKRVNL